MKTYWAIRFDKGGELFPINNPPELFNRRKPALARIKYLTFDRETAERYHAMRDLIAKPVKVVVKVLK